jgi:hypothetical protein
MSHSDSAIETDTELKRIYAYLERHVAPKDLNTVRWAFQLPIITEKDARQIEMAVTGE